MIMEKVKVKCRRCHLDLEPSEINVIMYPKNFNEEMILCKSCMRFISGLITASINDIIEEYILRKE